MPARPARDRDDLDGGDRATVPSPVSAPLLVIVGPTAVGKSAAALFLAEQIGGEIVSADSRTLYRGMDVGTAKPTAADRDRVPHHLLDIAEPDEIVTVARFRTAALDAIAAIRGRGRVPILVGGTGLYVRAVVEGLAIPAVPPDPALRASLEAEERKHPGTLHRRLAAVDPEAAAAIHPRNVRRIVRALEVHIHTGRPITSLQATTDSPPTRRFGITMERAALYARIEQRVEEQIAAGLVEETRRLLEAGYDRGLPSMRGLGYKEIAMYLAGERGWEEAVRLLKRNTRRHAKRQLTWFRRDPLVAWIEADGRSAAEVAADIRAIISGERLT